MIVAEPNPSKTFLDVLTKKRDDPSGNTAFVKFVSTYHGSENCVHAFMEGSEDLSFYTNYLERIESDSRRIHKYTCGGKKGVYFVYSRVRAMVKESGKLLFFVDKDHSDLIGEPRLEAIDIYITDYYSIENYLVTPDILRRLLEELVSQHSIDINVKAEVEKFQEQLDLFHNLVLPISAWIVHQRRQNKKLDLDKISLSTLFIIDNTVRLQQRQDYTNALSHLHETYNFDTPSDLASQLSKVIDELAQMNPKKHIRGKFELWFLIQYYKNLMEYLGRSAKEQGQKAPKFDLGKDLAIKILAPRVRMPDSLRVFFIANGHVPT